MDITATMRTGTAARFVDSGHRILTKEKGYAARVTTVSNAGNYGPISLGWRAQDGTTGTDTYYPSETVAVLAGGCAA